MNKIVILGAGAAPGVPSLTRGWGNCNPDNPKNKRLRAGIYIEYNGAKILIDTSPDLRQQLLSNNIRELDAVLYTHTHGDHLHGIDYLRELNRVMKRPLDIYADKVAMNEIKHGFRYLISHPKKEYKINNKPSLIPHLVKPNHSFYIKNVKVTPLKLLGHSEVSEGYSFDDGEIVVISDFKRLSQSALKAVTQKRPKVMIMPLTTNYEHEYHAGPETICRYNEIIKPERLIINHMSTDCDYDWVKSVMPDNAEPAYDNMIIEGI